MLVFPILDNLTSFRLAPVAREPGFFLWRLMASSRQHTRKVFAYSIRIFATNVGRDV